MTDSPYPNTFYAQLSSSLFSGVLGDRFDHLHNRLDFGTSGQTNFFDWIGKPLVKQPLD